MVSVPREMLGDGLSDQAPALVLFGCDPRVGIAGLLIPKLVWKHPSLKDHLNSLSKEVAIHDIEDSGQLSRYHSCIREAARRVGIETFIKSPALKLPLERFSLLFLVCCSIMIINLPSV